MQIENMESNETQIELSLMPIILMLTAKLRWLLMVPLICALLALLYSKLVDPIYHATVRILPPQYNENTVNALSDQFGGESQFGNSALTLANPTDLFVGVLNSRSIRDAVVADMDLAQHYGLDNGYDVRQRLSKNTDILAGKDGIVSLTAKDTDPAKAAAIANAYVNEFYSFSSQLARSEDARRMEFFDNALNRAKDKLLASDQHLSQVEDLTGFTRLDGQDQAIIQAAAELRAEISAREVQLSTMATYTTDTNPDVILIREELRNLRTELASLRDRRQVSAAEPFPQLGAVPNVMLEHSRSQREVEYWESIVLVLGKFTELGRIDERRDMSLFQVLDWATPPEKKSEPRTLINMVLAAVVSGFLCVAWFLISGYIQQRREQSVRFDAQWQTLQQHLMLWRKA